MTHDREPTPRGAPIAVVGPLADHPLAQAFAEAVYHVHHRYGVEVVLAHALCPFMRDPATAFGRFVVVLEREPTVETAFQVVAESESSVLHLIYPLVTLPPVAFERFANVLHERIHQELDDPPVHATFHPEMQGGRENAARLVGLLRHAPDPFVQFVPHGLTAGGSSFVNLAEIDLAKLLATPSASPRRSTFERLGPAALDALVALQADIRAERDRTYRRFLDAFAET